MGFLDDIKFQLPLDSLQEWNDPSLSFSRRALTPLSAIPNLELAKKVLPNWMNLATPPKFPGVIYPIPPSDPRMDGLVYPTDNKIRIKRKVINGDPNQLQYVGIHELVHNLQNQRPEGNQSEQLLSNFDFPTITKSSDARYTNTAEPKEKEADLLSVMLRNLSDAYKQNNYESSIGVRPH